MKKRGSWQFKFWTGWLLLLAGFVGVASYFQFNSDRAISNDKFIELLQFTAIVWGIGVLISYGIGLRTGGR